MSLGKNDRFASTHPLHKKPKERSRSQYEPQSKTVMINNEPPSGLHLLV